MFVCLFVCLTPGHPWETTLYLFGYPQVKEDVNGK